MRSGHVAVRALRTALVTALERACVLTHPVVHRRPWLWLPLPICPLSHLSWTLNDRWDLWKAPADA